MDDSPGPVSPFRRPFLPCLVALITGIWMAREFWEAARPFLPVLGGGLLLGMAGWSLLRRELTPLILLLFLMGGAIRVLPLLQERAEARALLHSLNPEIPRTLQGTVTTALEDNTYDRVRLTLSDVSLSSGSSAVELPGFLLVTLPSSPDAPEYHPGESLRLRAAVAEPGGYWNFFGFDSQGYLADRRVYATARIRAPQWPVKLGEAAPWDLRMRRHLAAFRGAAVHTLRRHMPAHEALLMEVLLFNDMRLLSDEDERIFRDSGTMHLFAVSGSHIALLALVLIPLLRSFRLRPRDAWTLTAAILFLYVWLLDFTAPAFRALLMLTSFVAGKWLGREVDGFSALAVGVAVILMLDPLALWQAGFQLSLMGVVAILLFVPLGRSWCAEFLEGEGWAATARRLLVDGAVVTGAVSFVLLPLQLFYFQQLNLLSPLANLVEGLLAPAVLASGVAVVGIGLCTPVPGDLLGAAAALLMKLSHVIAQVAADQSWAMLRVPQLPALAVLGFFLVLFSGYYVVHRHTPEFRPKSLARFGLHGAAALLLLGGFLVPAPAGNSLKIWFFDVGQGDSTLVQFPDGQSLLVDAGHILPDLGRMVVGPQLRALGVTPVEQAIATHADADHLGGFPWLLRTHGIRQLLEGTSRPAQDELLNLVDEACSATGTRRAQLLAGAPVQIAPETTVQVLNPIPELAAALSSNDQSIVLRIQHGKFVCLLMADAEEAVERRLAEEGIGKCDLLKVGHHGSSTSSIPEFLRKVRPAAAVISCGRRNRYGHPHPKVVRRLEALDCAIYRTDLHGAVLVESDGDGFMVTTVRQPKAKP